MLEVEAKEEPDWDFARNKHVVLKSSMGEWSSSVFSSEVLVDGECFLGPNRDYPHQGLLLSKGSEVYKIIDGIMFSQEKGFGERVEVRAYSVRYIYQNLKVEFSFMEDSFQTTFDRDGVRVLPFLDVKNVNGMVDLDPVQVSHDQGWLRVEGSSLRVAIGPFKKVERVNYSTEWIYKLGSGFRYSDCDGYMRFVREARRISAPAICTLNGRVMKVIVEGLKTDDAVRKNSWMNRLTFLESKLRDLMILRLSTLRCFGLNLHGHWFPEAGCWWFRYPWIRDALEGVLSNFQVYTGVFGWEERIKGMAITLINILERRGSLPNLLGGNDHSADAPPLLLYLCSKLGGDLSEKAASLAYTIIEGMERREAVEDGPPVIRDGLVACLPNQSWTDSEVDGRACRLPKTWNSDEWRLPRYFLPEVNGQWIRALRGLCRVAPSRSDGLREKLSEMETAFREFLWNGKFVSDIVDSEDGKRSDEVTSTGLVGFATAMHIFNQEELKSEFQSVRRLIVNRTMRVLGNCTVPFGVAVSKKVAPYLGNEEYHSSTIWPRDTPYLIDVLDALGLEIEIRSILLNNLDHMVSEGGLLYANELFGHPVGRNPYPSNWSLNPIPLKNPAQYWSHWCDPYLNRFIRLI
ncbi:MAG: hypothetical protein ACUVQ5_03535 [Candidatus Methanomethylicaceae archaeon]